MKNIQLLVYLFICISFITCTKLEKTVSTKNAAINEALKTKLIEWMETQKNSSQEESSIFIDSLENEAEWENLKTSSVYGGQKKLIYIPINYNKNTTGLVFLINTNNQSIDYGILAEVSNNIKYSDKKNRINLMNADELMTDFYNGKIDNFSGAISAYTLTKKFMWEKGYKLGKYIYLKQVRKKNSTLNSHGPSILSNDVKAPKVNGCIDWYLVTWDGDGNVISEVFLYETCGDDCESTKVISKDSTLKIKTFCGSGSSSSISQINSDCSMSESDARDILSDITCSSGADYYYTDDGDEVDMNLDLIRRTRNTTWDCAKITVNGVVLGYSSNFTGTITYKRNVGPWKWETFAYSNTVHSSGKYPTCLDVIVNATCSTAISGDNLSADADLIFFYETKWTCISGIQTSSPQRLTAFQTFRP